MRRSPLAVVSLTVFLDLLGFGIILPARPYLAGAALVPAAAGLIGGVRAPREVALAEVRPGG